MHQKYMFAYQSRGREVLIGTPLEIKKHGKTGTYHGVTDIDELFQILETYRKKEWIITWLSEVQEARLLWNHKIGMENVETSKTID